MNPSDWLLHELASSLAGAVEGMTGDRPSIASAAPAAEPRADAFRSRQTFTALPGALWLAAETPDWSALGAQALAAAGLDENAPEKLKAEYLEIVKQAFSGLAQAISARLDREIRCEQPNPASTAAGLAWSSVQLKIEDSSIRLLAAIEPGLAAALAPDDPPSNPSKTFELLLDVELPVSISLGRAQVPLKDVLKLTTGSIVELNRAIGDPVEVIVNNCVIARGEVVTIEGNFGVRIQQVISRQERLRTLK